MKTEFLAKLEGALQKLIDDNCEQEYWNGYMYEDLVKDMAAAAASVFDACMKGQKFAERENG